MKRLFFSLFIYVPTFAISQDFALEKLNESPRHHEWVKIESSDKTLDVFVVYPESPNRTTSVLVIHENRGLTDWVRSMADQIAEAGYIAVAPDLLSGKAPNGGNTRNFGSPDDARTAIYQLEPDEVTADLNSVYKYMVELPASNGKSAVMGFCWGGSQTFRYATNNPEIVAAMVFYGTGPKENSQIKRINSPVYGFYGGDDERVNATIKSTSKMMIANELIYDYQIYKGAGHAYMRHGEDPSGSDENKKAREESLIRMKLILEGIE